MKSSLIRVGPAPSVLRREEERQRHGAEATRGQMEQRLGDVATSQETGSHRELEEAGRAVRPHPCRERPSHTWTQTCGPRAGRAALIGSPWSVLCCYCPGTPTVLTTDMGGP